jgi:hypothetical protein
MIQRPALGMDRRRESPVLAIGTTISDTVALALLTS